MDCDRPLIKVLIECQCIEPDLDPALYCSPSSRPIKALSRQGLLDERVAVESVAKRLGIECLDLFNEKVKGRCTVAKYFSLITPELCTIHKVLPLYEERGGVVAAFANPFDVDAMKQLRFLLGTDIRVAIAEEDKILTTLAQHTPTALSMFEQENIDKSEEHIEFVASASDECNLDNEQEGAAPIIRFINRVFIEALRLRASDIHFDATPNGLDVRFRVDGVMQHIFDTPKRLQRPVVSRIKLLAGMNIAEKRAPQDGRFRITFEDEPVDLRVSCVPTSYGEKIVLRVLQSNFQLLSFERLGMPPTIQTQLETDLALPSRMILVTGPTGSGKSTTLYTALKFICDGTSNIITIEDPIEYKIPGINQIQINEPAGVEFASCLRSILRQDPDVIMVGEIRDAETATIALQAAQTGHLVLSTLHTNDAPSAITRLLHLGCDPFVLSSSLAGVLAQRLVRKICGHCITSLPPNQFEAEKSLLAEYQVDPKALRHGSGCERCRFTGYYGRLGVYSYFRISDHLSSLIHTGAFLPEIVENAIRSGFVELHEAALAHLRAGVTTLAEIQPFLAARKVGVSEDRSGAQFAVSSGTPRRDLIDKRRETVMLIEDDTVNRKLIADLLRQRHFRVSEFESGVLALQRLRQTAPGLVVMGLGLPGIDGRELLSRLRDEDGMDQVPIVVITSADSDENEAELLRRGADDFMSRSRSPEVLVERVERALRLRRH